MGKAGLHSLGTIVRECEVEDLVLSRCDLGVEELESFRGSVGGAKVIYSKKSLATEPSYIKFNLILTFGLT